MLLRRLALVSSLLAISSTIALVFDPSVSAATGSGLPGELSAVTPLTATNVWTVGSYFSKPTDPGDFTTLTEHWLGSSWSKISSPNPAGYTSQLSGVDALSSSNVWAVGRYNATTGLDRTLIEHWTGSGWHIVSSPNPQNFGNTLNAVKAISATNVWAVGYGNSPAKTLIEHWNGSAWNAVGGQNPGPQGDVLSAVDALAGNDVWTVGYYVEAGSGPKTLIEHWNGSAWSTVAGVDPSSSDNELTGVSAVAADDVWAVGYYTTGTGDKTLIEHWDGTSWSQVTSPNPTTQSALAAVSALSSDDVWAVGSTGVSVVNTLIAHWNGTAWVKVASANPSGSENELIGVAAQGAKDVWAVGYENLSSGHKTLIEHWNGTSWVVK